MPEPSGRPMMKEENMDEKRLNQQFAFSQEIDKEKTISRMTYISDGARRENDAEHAWHAALMAILLAEYSNEPIDVLRTVTMLLLHDLVEIDAGDAFAYDPEAQAAQHDKELRAADRLYGLLPEDQRTYFRGLWEEFEAGTTPEARFARVMDNLQPLMLNAMQHGRLWREQGVALRQVMARNQRTPDGSATLWEYARRTYIQPNVEAGNIKNK